MGRVSFPEVQLLSAAQTPKTTGKKLSLPQSELMGSSFSRSC